MEITWVKDWSLSLWHNRGSQILPGGDNDNSKRIRVFVLSFAGGGGG